MFSTRQSSFLDYRSHLLPQPMRPSMRGFTNIENRLRIALNFPSLSLIPIPLCTRTHVTACTQRHVYIRIQTKACPVIIALLGYWTPNHEVTTVSNRALLAPGTFTLVYVSIKANYFASEFQFLSSLSTLLSFSFLLSYPSLCFYTIIMFLLFLLLWNQNLQSPLTLFHQETKRDETFFPPSSILPCFYSYLPFLNYHHPPFHRYPLQGILILLGINF